jgi:spore maturation protein CgeB
MNASPLRIVFLGLSITSSWGNGHATTYRALVRELGRRGHRVLFLERNVYWYAENRDLPAPPGCVTELYEDVEDLRARFSGEVSAADFVVLGSYVPEGREVASWVLDTATGATAFYDIDTPVTLAKLDRDEADYVSRALVPRFDLYLSFTGGPTLDRLERTYGARAARPLYCSVDIDQYFPEPSEARWDIGYLGTYSDDRQPTLARLLLTPARALPARRFVVAGPQYPASIQWPPNVERAIHLAPREHRAFYNAQRFTLNVTRADMVRAGYSPSVRLFEAAACGTAIISDVWQGLGAFFRPGEEILVARNSEDVIRYLGSLPDGECRAIGARARERVLEKHTAAHRAAELEGYALEVLRRDPAVA